MVQFGVLAMGGRFVFVVTSGYLTSVHVECYHPRKTCPSMLGSVQSLTKIAVARMKIVYVPNSPHKKLKPFWGFPSALAKSMTPSFGRIIHRGNTRQRVHINFSLGLRPLDLQTPQLTVVPGTTFGIWKF